MKKLDIMKMYEWPSVPKAFVFGLVFALAFYLGYLFDLSDLRKSLADSQQQEESNKEQLEGGLQREIALKNDISRFKAINTLLGQWQNKLITFPGLPELLNDILKIGSANHVYFSIFSPGDEVKVGRYTKIPIKVLVVGSYHQLGNFISQIANMSQIVVVSDFIISSEIKNDVLGEKLAAQASDEGLLTGEFLLEIYYQTENPAPESVKNGL